MLGYIYICGSAYPCFFDKCSLKSDLAAKAEVCVDSKTNRQQKHRAAPNWLVVLTTSRLVPPPAI